ncbi:probable WRKY transcription factor 50 [Phalaenopsis equestris]|uniref:probable WRKY transcription factor 50 n=1 Tax=Phalaenopsis equestris TaxID=78828 RepID=UPI0009E27D86|nr:probable WRKY transcription factor 50 [Phalaenopsis equestris]
MDRLHKIGADVTVKADEKEEKRIGDNHSLNICKLKDYQKTVLLQTKLCFSPPPMASNSSVLSSNFSPTEVFDDIYFEFDDSFVSEETFSENQQLVSQYQRGTILHHVNDCGSRNTNMQQSNQRLKKTKVSFKTKSDRDVLDDGYKWRKYGKKMVKSSSNPRNYYRCSMEGCNVKKRIERMEEDSGYVITSYEGIHNHYALNQHDYSGT